jgi:hypothetical protein
MKVVDETGENFTVEFLQYASQYKQLTKYTNDASPVFFRVIDNLVITTPASIFFDATHEHRPPDQNKPTILIPLYFSVGVITKNASGNFRLSSVTPKWEEFLNAFALNYTKKTFLSIGDKKYKILDVFERETKVLKQKVFSIVVKETWHASELPLYLGERLHDDLDMNAVKDLLAKKSEDVNNSLSFIAEKLTHFLRKVYFTQHIIPFEEEPTIEIKRN